MEWNNFYILIILTALLISFRRPLHAVYLLLILLPLERAFVTDIYNLHIKLAEWMGLICIIVFAWNYLIRPQKGMFPLPVLIPLLIFVLFNLVYLFITIPELMKYGIPADFNSPGYRTIKVVAWCAYSALLSMAICYSIKDVRDLKNCVGVLLVTALVVCGTSLFAMIMYLAGTRLLPWALIGRAEFVGIKATFSEPAYFALYMSTILPVALLVFLLRVYRLGLFFTIAACFILLLANYFSFSTTGLAGVTLVIIIVPYLIRHYRLAATPQAVRYVITILICLYIVFIVGALFNIDFIRVTTLNYFDKLFQQNTRWAGRLMGYRMFLDHPIMGVGPGNWWYYAQKIYMPAVMKETFVRPSYNCLYWEILADLGIVGFIIFAWLFFSLFRQLFKSVWRTEDIFLRAIAVGLIIGFATLLGEYYVAFNFYRVYVWATIGIAMATIRLAAEKKPAE